MKNLLDFIIKYSSWFVFLFFAVMSCLLLFQSNPYQHSIYFTSANAVSSAVYGLFNNVTSYFHLRGINEDLQQRNAMLENEVVSLRNQINDYKMQMPDTNSVRPEYQNFDFVIAHVISNSISQPYNYITINRGRADGVLPEMGVVDQNGVVGIVNVVGEHSARIISLLNPNLRLSCKVKDSDFFGSLVWDCVSPQYAVLEELPRHVEFENGDTIITSGYSAVFPEGLIVGTIEDKMPTNDDNFYTLKIKLTTDFSRLSTVRAISNGMKEELDALEAADFGNGKKGGRK